MNLAQKIVTTQKVANFVCTLHAPPPSEQSLVEPLGLEASILKELQGLQLDFRNYDQTFLREVGVQREAADKLWHLTQRYMIVMGVDTNCSRPQNYAIEPEETIIGEYNLIYQVLLGSNRRMEQAIFGMRPNLLQFRQSCRQLDQTEETPFICGDNFHKPIQYFMNLMEEIYSFFHSSHLKMEYMVTELDPLDWVPLDNYKKLLIPNYELAEYLMKSLTYCKCLNPRQLCPLRMGLDKEKSEEKTIRKPRPCSQRHVRMLRETISDPVAPVEPQPYVIRELIRPTEVSNIRLALNSIF